MLRAPRPQPHYHNGDAEDDQDDLGGGLMVFIAMMIMVLMVLMSILMSTITTNGDAGRDLLIELDFIGE